MNKLTKLIFQRKGYSQEYIEKIKHWDATCELKDTQTFTQYLHRNKDKIYTQISDFDGDGLMSGIIGYAGMCELGFRINLYTSPTRCGYGFNNLSIIDHMLAQFPQTQVVITSDNGIECQEGIAYLRSKGITVIVTDHHLQKEPSNADICIDPYRLDETYPQPDICGAFVLWKCLYKYALEYGTPFMQEQIYRLRIFAGIATVTDMMPMKGENRAIVKDAVDYCKLLASTPADNRYNKLFFQDGCTMYQNAFCALWSMLKCLEEKKKLYEVSEETFGFTIGPMLNAVKRVASDTYPVYRLFFGASNNEARAEAFETLFELNEQRKVITEQYCNALKVQEENGKQPYAPFIYLTDAPEGIRGLIANSIMEATGLPCFVVMEYGNSVLRGSGRLPEWISAKDDLQGHVPSLSTSGHAHSFGVKISANDIEKTCRLLKEKSEALMPEQEKETLAYDLLITDTYDEKSDTSIDNVPLLWDFCKEIQEYGPFGPEFERPVIILRIQSKNAVWKRIGSESQHWKGTMENGTSILIWNCEAKELPETIIIDGKPQISSFRGMESLDFAGSLVQQELGQDNGTQA